MRISLSQLLTLLFVALAFVTGCNPPTNPTCSSYIGQATINEVSKVQANATNSNTLDDANDFVEIKILNNSLTTATLNSWNVLICEKGTSNCYGGALSSATVTTATDGSGARYYVIKSLTNVGRVINFAVGTEVALSDQNDYAVDYLSIAGYVDHKPSSCTFSYGTTASTATTTRRIRRNADGTGNWEVVNANDQPATEGLNNTTMPPIAAEWRMDEASWNGTSNEVVATTSSLQGTSKNGATTKNTTPAKSTNPGTCRYGDFDGVNDYVAVTNGSTLDFPTAMTFTGWIYPRTVGSGATARGTIMSKGIMSTTTSSDYVYALRLNTANDLIFYQCASFSSTCSAYSTATATSATSLLNKWTHVAVSFHSGYQKIYLNGVEATAASNIGALPSNTRALNIGATPNSATSPSTYYHPLDGALDEMRFYNAALTQTQVQSVMNEIHACGPLTVDHFSIAPASATAVTCDSVAVTLTPHTSGEETLTTYTGTVTLTAKIGTTATGSWELITGTSTNFTSTGTGTATYKFAAGETSATFRYKNLAAGVVNFTATDGAVAASENTPVTFSTAGFIFLVDGVSGASIPTQISGKSSNTGWNNKTLSIRAVKTDDNTAQCVARLPQGSQSVEFAYDCVNPDICSSGASFSVTGAATNAIPANQGAPTTWQTVNLTFDSSATATFVTNFSDAGQVQLTARKVLGSDANGPAMTLAANAALNVRPFALRFNAISGNSSGTASAGSGFIAAGATFPLTVDAIAYDGVDAMAGNGYPVATAVLTNNAVTPNFTLPSIPLTINSFTPTGGAAGLLSANSASFSGGSASLSGVTYSEVGSIKLRAAASNYLGGLSVQGDSSDIGRFYPQNFVLVSPSVTQACPSPTTSTPFTYMGQSFAVNYLLEARNTGNTKTLNYDTTAGYATASITPVAENADNGTNLVSRLAVSAGRWDEGVYVFADGASSFTVNNAVFARNTSAADGPFSSLQLGIVLTDADSRNITSLDMNATTAGSCSPSSCTAKAIGSANMRYGRLALRDATGSDRGSAIVIPALAEYYDGSQFVRNEADSCTTYGYGGSQINDVDFSGTTTLLASYNDSRGTTAGQWWLPAAGSSTKLSAGLFGNYPNALSIKPVAGVTGTLGVSLSSTSVPGWLQYNWAGTGDTGPSCKLTLGQARGNDHVVFWRERH